MVEKDIRSVSMHKNINHLMRVPTLKNSFSDFWMGASLNYKRSYLP